jgi:phosphatidylglycerol:prolipoprotein diacylglycerol transferase
MYLIGFGIAWLLCLWRAKHYKLDWTSDQISDLVFYVCLGVILGGRVGYMVFYNFDELIHQPLTLFKIWEGGMSFHGGLLGVMLAIYLIARKFHKSFWEVADFTAPSVPLAIGAGRLGNFINGELWGRVTHVPWAMVYPQVDAQPRHPSQLYEFGLEGLLLFALVWWYASKPRPAGTVSGVFLMAYAVLRMVAECFREPDAPFGFIAFNWLTMGQLLSLPMLILGFWLWWTKR